MASRAYCISVEWFFCAPGKQTLAITDEFQPFAEDLFSYKTWCEAQNNKEINNIDFHKTSQNDLISTSFKFDS